MDKVKKYGGAHVTIPLRRMEVKIALCWERMLNIEFVKDLVQVCFFMSSFLFILFFPSVCRFIIKCIHAILTESFSTLCHPAVDCLHATLTESSSTFYPGNLCSQVVSSNLFPQYLFISSLLSLLLSSYY